MLNRGLQKNFFFHPGKSRLSLATSRTKGNWSLEEKRLMFSSISKCLLILRFYLGQPISSSFSSSSRPLAALNSAFSPSLTQGETCALLSKRKRKTKKKKKKKVHISGAGFCSRLGTEFRHVEFQLRKAIWIFFTGPPPPLLLLAPSVSRLAFYLLPFRWLSSSAELGLIPIEPTQMAEHRRYGEPMCHSIMVWVLLFPQEAASFSR